MLRHGSGRPDSRSDQEQGRGAARRRGARSLCARKRGLRQVNRNHTRMQDRFRQVCDIGQGHRLHQGAGGAGRMLGMLATCLAGSVKAELGQGAIRHGIGGKVIHQRHAVAMRHKGQRQRKERRDKGRNKETHVPHDALI